MPASSATFAKLASVLEGYDPVDAGETEFFFVNVYPRYSEAVRQTIGDWMASLTMDATEADFELLLKALVELGDFRAKSADNPYRGSDKVAAGPPQAASQEEHYYQA